MRYIYYKDNYLHCDYGNYQETRNETLENLFNKEKLFGYIPITYKEWCQWWQRHSYKREYMLPYFHEKAIWCPISSVYSHEAHCINIYGLKDFELHPYFIRCYFPESVIDLYISKTKMYTMLERLTLMIDRFKIIGVVPEWNTQEWENENPYLNINRYLNRKNGERIFKKQKKLEETLTVYNFRELFWSLNTEKI